MVLSESDDIFFDIKDWSSSQGIFGSNSAYTAGRLILTNSRLVLVKLYSNERLVSGRFSFTSIAGFSERPTNDLIPKYPYQAHLILFSGQILIIETPKDNIKKREQELSNFLLKAFLLFGNPLNAHLMATVNLEKVREEEERRRND